MSQHYFSKSALALSLIVAGLASASLAQADENTTGLTSVTAPTLEAPSTTEEVTEGLAPIENTTENVNDETPIATSLENPPTPNTTLVTPVEGQTVDIRIALTTDLHTNLVNYDYYQDKEAQNIGLAKTAVLLKKQKQKIQTLSLLIMVISSKELLSVLIRLS